MSDQDKGAEGAAAADASAAAGAAGADKGGAAGDAAGSQYGAAGGSVLEGGAAGDDAAAAAAAGADKGGTAEGDKGAAGESGSVSLLADAAAAAAGKTGDQGAEKKDKSAAAEAKPPTEEEVGAFIGKLKPEDLGVGADGQPVAWDDGAVKAVAPVLMELGLDSEKSQKVIAAYAGYRREQFKAALQQDAQVQKAMKEECVKTFGADLQRVSNEAYRGGLHVFGAELFGEFLNVPAFGNDVRVLNALAAVGRAVTDDPAAGSAASPAGAGKDRPLLDRLYTDADFKKAADGK